MSTATANGVSLGLRRYAEALSSRRGLRKALGPDTDPDFCFADFLFAVGTKDYRRLNTVYSAERSKTAMSVSASGAQGGWLVPTELALDLMRDVAEEAIVRPRATVVSMGSSVLRLPLPDATTAQSEATAPFFGGILMSWTQEAATRGESEPQFRQVELKAWELSGYAKESNPLYEDGGAGLETFLRKIFARSIAWYEDYAYLRGNGVGKPQGVMDAPGRKTVARETAGTFTALDSGNMAAALLPASWARACWLIHPSVWPKMVVLATSGWGANHPITDLGAGPHFILHGRPGYVTEKLPALGTEGDVCLCDFGLYVIGDRGAVEIDVSFHEPTAFLNNQCVWRVVYRGDGQPWLNDVVTLQDASTTVSPFVVLTDAAA